VISKVQPRLPREDRYLRLLCIALACYAIIGKGFAYLGVPPIFVGELLLVVGLWLWAENRFIGLNAPSAPQLLLIGYMIWGAMRTAPDVGFYGVDAVRDAVVWGYGLFALVVSGLLLAKPERLEILYRGFLKFVKVFLATSPFAFLIGMWGTSLIPNLPFSKMPMFGPYNTSDAMLHLAGMFAYLSTCVPLGSGLVRPWMLAAMGASIVANFNGRSGLVAFGVGAAIVTMLRPFNKLAIGMGVAALIGLGIFWITDFRIELPPSGRYLSIEQFTDNITSIFSDTDRAELAGSKRWRLAWWDTIVDYTFRGRYFWTGKGFGINLANADGFQVIADGSLRSPHNGHLTILARAGVPGLGLWACMNLAWGLAVFDAFIRAVRAKEKRWAGAFVFLLSYWAAFLVNIAFDVFLEGPVGGIWFWTLFGVGLAAVRVHRTSPQVLPDFERVPNPQLDFPALVPSPA
jgi:hypothetical protein